MHHGIRRAAHIAGVVLCGVTFAPIGSPAQQPGVPKYGASGASFVPLDSMMRGGRFVAPLQLARRITVQRTSAPLSQVLFDIATEAGLGLSYGRELSRATVRVSLDLHGATVADALAAAVAGTEWTVLVSAAGQITAVRDGGRRVDGIIAGRVTEHGTSMAVASAQVIVVGKGWTRYTDEKGQYRIPAVPPGEYEMTVRRLGFQAASRHIRVSDGETVTADFTMARAPTTLTEVVTTATGERSRLEVGNAIGTIKADSIVPTTLIRNMSDLLSARTPGVVVQNTSGLVGQPSRIRIRGISSVQLNNDPIVIVDGVRLLTQTTNDPDQMNVGRGVIANTVGNAGGLGFTTQNAPSRLDDIDPNTIESIDVLRGPSAATLYGTEAAKGVIVIKTKQGKAGPFRFSLLADDGWSTFPGSLPLHWASWGHAVTGGIIDPRGEVGNFSNSSCWVTGVFSNFVAPNYADGTCTLDSVKAFNATNTPQMSTLGTGTAQNVTGEMSGGTEQLREFLSLRMSNNIGMAKLSEVEQRRITQMWGETPPSWMMHPNTEQDVNGSSRTNLHATANLDLSFSANALYRDILGGTAATPGTPGTNNQMITSLADTLLYLPAEALRPKQETVAKRGFASATANYTPMSWLALHGTFGGDYTLRTDEFMLRPAECTVAFAPSTGCNSTHQDERGETFVTTMDVGAQATFTPFHWLTSRTAIGEQASKTTFYSLGAGNTNVTNLAFGTTLLTPNPVATSGTPQLFSVGESRDAGATAGWYLEQTAALWQRLFLTAAFREDAASAFGPTVNKQLPVYPKFSLSWLLSDEAFFPWKSVISSFRLRTAYGQSGTQARQNDVLGNYTVGNVLDDNGVATPGISFSQVANPDLRPERVAEWEGGFDLSLLENERFHLEATLYRKLSQDAILSVTLPPSYGTAAIGSVSLSQRQNVGAVENRGVELSVDAKLFDTRTFGWELTVNMTQNANKLIHMNPGVSSISAFNANDVRVGMPLFGYYGRQVRSYADANGDGLLNYNTEVAFSDSTVFFGASYPKSEVTWVNSITLLNGTLRLNATVDQINGASTRLTSTTTQAGAFRVMVDPTTTLAQQAVAVEGLANNAFLNQSTSLRFSELSLTYTMPRRLARRLFFSQSASVTFAGRNLGLWTTYPGKDPNVDSSTTVITGGFTDATQDSGHAIPQPRNWTFRINLGY